MENIKIFCLKSLLLCICLPFYQLNAFDYDSYKKQMLYGYQQMQKRFLNPIYRYTQEYPRLFWGGILVTSVSAALIIYKVKNKFFKSTNKITIKEQHKKENENPIINKFIPEDMHISKELFKKNSERNDKNRIYVPFSDLNLSARNRAIADLVNTLDEKIQEIDEYLKKNIPCELIWNWSRINNSIVKTYKEKYKSTDKLPSLDDQIRWGNENPRYFHTCFTYFAEQSDISIDDISKTAQQIKDISVDNELLTSHLWKYLAPIISEHYTYTWILLFTRTIDTITDQSTWGLFCEYFDDRLSEKNNGQRWFTKIKYVYKTNGVDILSNFINRNNELQMFFTTLTESKSLSNLFKISVPNAIEWAHKFKTWLSVANQCEKITKDIIEKFKKNASQQKLKTTN